jgi:hypothetical protein
MKSWIPGSARRVTAPEHSPSDSDHAGQLSTLGHRVDGTSRRAQKIGRLVDREQHGQDRATRFMLSREDSRTLGRKQRHEEASRHRLR